MAHPYTVVFDLDGTLVDTSADLIAAANRTLAQRGLPETLDLVKDAAISFEGGRAMLEAGYGRADGWLVPPGAAEEDYPRLLAHYGDHIAVHSKAYPGLTDTLDALDAEGFLLSVCTNKPEELARELLGGLGLLDRFAALVGADTLPVRKPDPAPYRAAVVRAGGEVSRSCLIGDTLTDRDTARAAGVPIVLVGFGPRGQGVHKYAPDVVIDHFSDLPGVAVKLRG